MTTNINTFIHIDAANLFHRQINMVNTALGLDSAIGMALHTILYSMKKEFNKWEGTHVVFYIEGRSWRKDVYPEYKANRAVIFAKKTVREQEDHGILVEAFDDLVSYIYNKTNITVLQNPRAEADDMISIFIESHPDDKHILISSDSDFFQLLRHPNVMLYDPVKDIQIRQDGIFDDDGNRLEFIIKSDAKIKVGKKNPNFVCEDKWYEWALFLKCIRGDVTDNIFSAYPGVHVKGTKSKIGIRDAYTDVNKGYNWNNFMMQKFNHHDGTEHRVLDDYNLNKSLIDLSLIPDDIKTECLNIISKETAKENIPAVEIGHHFMKFAGKWALKRIGDAATTFMPMIKSPYKGNKI